MKKFARKKKIWITGLCLLVGFVASAISLQLSLTQVSADVWPIMINVGHINYGTVFPGEILEKEFLVTNTDDGNEVKYAIVKERKPLPNTHLEYPNGGDPAMPGFYRDLCPYLENLSLEGEGDTNAEASVKTNDMKDIWKVYLEVPAIFKHVAQDHTGGIVDAIGEYGCDLSIDVLYEPASICGTKFFDIEKNLEFDGDDYVLPGWTINLFEETGCTIEPECDNGWEVLQSEITDNNGDYCFESLAPGTYRVKEVNQSGWIAVVPNNPDYYHLVVQEGQNFQFFDFANNNPSLIK